MPWLIAMRFVTVTRLPCALSGYVQTMSSTAKFYTTQIAPVAVDLPHDALQSKEGLEFATSPDFLEWSRRFQTALAAEFQKESQLQTAVEGLLKELVSTVSGGQIKLHDTHKRPYLDGLKPDLSGTAPTTTTADGVEATQVLLAVEIKLEGNLRVARVLGQVAEYALELVRARAVVGPSYVVVMNKTHMLIVVVLDMVPTKVYVSHQYSLLETPGSGSPGCGLRRLVEFVLVCAALAERQAATEWGRKYIPLRPLGAGAIARAMVARPLGGVEQVSDEDKSNLRVVIKVFNPSEFVTPEVVNGRASPLARMRADDGAVAIIAPSAHTTGSIGDLGHSTRGRLRRQPDWFGRAVQPAGLDQKAAVAAPASVCCCHSAQAWHDSPCLCCTPLCYCPALPGTKLSENEACFAKRAKEAMTPHALGPGFALTPTVVAWGADYVAFEEIGESIDGSRFYKHHSIEVCFPHRLLPRCVALVSV